MSRRDVANFDAYRPEDYAVELLTAPPSTNGHQPDAFEAARQRLSHDGEHGPGVTLRDRLLTVDQLAELPPPRSLITDVIDLDNVGLTYGRRGSYKSFLALDWALCVATGVPWQGCPVTAGTVLIVVGEGVSGVYQRIDAWQAHRGPVEIGERLLILPEPVNLLSPGAVSVFADTVSEVGAVFVVLDTLARCLVGGDENSAKDTGIALDSLDLIRRRSGAHVHAVHHAGKDAKAGARGSSAIEAAADSVFEVTAADSIVTLTTTKQKNRPESPAVRMVALPVGSSVVLAPSEGPAPGAMTIKEREAIDVLEAIAVPEGVPLTMWVAAADDIAISKATVVRARKKALESGVIGLGSASTEKQPRYVVTRPTGVNASSEEETADEQD